MDFRNRGKVLQAIEALDRALSLLDDVLEDEQDGPLSAVLPTDYMDQVEARHARLTELMGGPVA